MPFTPPCCTFDHSPQTSCARRHLAHIKAMRDDFNNLVVATDDEVPRRVQELHPPPAEVVDPLRFYDLEHRALPMSARRDHRGAFERRNPEPLRGAELDLPPLTIVIVVDDHRH